MTRCLTSLSSPPMIVDPTANSTDDKKQLEESLSSQLGEASNPAPPPFEFNQQDHELVDISGTESTPLIHTSPTDRAHGPPPEFAPYNAEHFSLDNQDIVSHDPHLNADGLCSVYVESHVKSSLSNNVRRSAVSFFTLGIPHEAIVPLTLPRNS